MLCCVAGSEPDASKVAAPREQHHLYFPWSRKGRHRGVLEVHYTILQSLEARFKLQICCHGGQNCSLCMHGGCAVERSARGEGDLVRKKPTSFAAFFFGGVTCSVHSLLFALLVALGAPLLKVEKAVIEVLKLVLHFFDGDVRERNCLQDIETAPVALQHVFHIARQKVVYCVVVFWLLVLWRRRGNSTLRLARGQSCW